MKRAAVLVAVAVIGALVGAAGTAAVQEEPAERAKAAMAPSTTVAAATTAPPPTQPAPGPDVLLAWAQGGLPAPAREAAATAPGVQSVAVVFDGRADLVGSADADGLALDVLEPGWSIALDVAAVDPATYAAVVPTADRPAVAALAPGEAILSETSAELRRLGPGGRLDMAGGVTLRVVAVVPDASVGGAEVVVDTATGAQLGADVPRAALIAYDGDRAAVEAAIVAAAGGVPVRFRAPGETPYLRAADAVLPQSIVKAAFGEFAHRPVGGATRDIEIDPAWIEAAIVDAEVPVLGAVRCHRAIVEPLREAMAAIDAAGLGDELAASGFDGCFVPRFVQPGGSLSRHSWGIAFDVGYSDNPTSASSAHDERIVEVLRDAGFTWGGTWLVPDPAHFEVVTPTRARRRTWPRTSTRCPRAGCGARRRRSDSARGARRRLPRRGSARSAATSSVTSPATSG